MKKNLFPFYSFAILILMACNQSGKKASESNGAYSIDAPAGWEKSDTTVMGFRTIVLMSPLQHGDLFRENVNVVTEKAPGLTPDNYFKLNKSNMEKMLSEFQHLGEGDLTIGKLQSKWLKYAHNYMGTPIEAKAFLIINDGQVFIITCSALNGEYSKFENEFQQAVNSFRIK